VEIKFTARSSEIAASISTPSTRRLLDGVAMRFLTARRSPHNPAIAEVHPTSWLIPTRELAALVDERPPLRPGNFHGRPQPEPRPARSGIERELRREDRQHAARRLQMHRLPRREVLASFQQQVETPQNAGAALHELLRDIRQSRRASTSIIRPLRRGIDRTARVPN